MKRKKKERVLTISQTQKKVNGLRHSRHIFMSKYRTHM